MRHRTRTLLVTSAALAVVAALVGAPAASAHASSAADLITIAQSADHAANALIDDTPADELDEPREPGWLFIGLAGAALGVILVAVLVVVRRNP